MREDIDKIGSNKLPLFDKVRRYSSELITMQPVTTSMLSRTASTNDNRTSVEYDLARFEKQLKGEVLLADLEEGTG